MRKSILHNPALLCLHHVLYATLFPVAIFSLFWTQQIGMSVSTLLATQAFFGLVIALFEFPSGYVADRLGHRRALLIGTAVVALGWVVYSLATSLGSVILAELVLGIGFALISGADSALLYDSLQARGEAHSFARWYGRMRSLAQLAEGTSALLAGWLYATWARLPFVVEVGVWLLALLVAWRLVETPRHEVPSSNHLARMRWIVRHALLERPDLRVVLLASVAFGLASFAPVWLIPLYATDAGVPVTWVGPIWAAANYVIALGALLSDRMGRRFGASAVLLFCTALVAVGYAGLGLSQALYGFAFFFLISLMRGLHTPLLHHEEQRRVPSTDRASFVSFRSFMFRGAFVVLGPLVGIAVDAHGQHPVLLVLGAAMVAATGATALWWVRVVRREPIDLEGALPEPAAK